MQLQRVSGLDVEQDLAFQARWWRFQTVARGALYAVLAAGLLGLLGHGPLDRATAGEPGAPLSVAYHRFIHYQTDTHLAVRLGPEAYQGAQASIWLDKAFVDAVTIDHIVPMPARWAIGTDRVVYTFDVAEPGSPLEVTFQVIADVYGPLQVRLGTTRGQAVGLGLFVYP